MLGFLNVYKGSGVTSNYVVQKIKKKFHIDKIGHLGTLDPMATGVLPIAIGKATRMFDYALNKTKRYIAIFDFGYTTDTLDVTGNITEKSDIIPSEEQLKKASENLLGEIAQVPPLYSAKCVNGRRAYDLARVGIEFTLKSKNVTIYKLDLIEKISENQYKFDIHCSSGTYIRSIARDLAELCDTYGCMSYLERYETGVFNKSTSISLEDILSKDNIDENLISIVDAFPNFDIININREIADDLLNGKRPKYQKLTNNTFVLCNNELLGIAKCNSEELILETFLYEQRKI